MFWEKQNQTMSQVKSAQTLAQEDIDYKDVFVLALVMG